MDRQEQAGGSGKELAAPILPQLRWGSAREAGEGVFTSDLELMMHISRSKMCDREKQAGGQGAELEPHYLPQSGWGSAREAGEGVWPNKEKFRLRAKLGKHVLPACLHRP
jgi:hypothetical protein